MATKTTHYKMEKPDYVDPADVSAFNRNSDIVDDALWQLANTGTDNNIISVEGSPTKKAYFEVGTDGVRHGNRRYIGAGGRPEDS